MFRILYLFLFPNQEYTSSDYHVLSSFSSAWGPYLFYPGFIWRQIGRDHTVVFGLGSYSYSQDLWRGRCEVSHDQEQYHIWASVRYLRVPYSLLFSLCLLMCLGTGSGGEVCVRRGAYPELGSFQVLGIFPNASSLLMQNPNQAKSKQAKLRNIQV